MKESRDRRGRPVTIPGGHTFSELGQGARFTSYVNLRKNGQGHLLGDKLSSPITVEQPDHQIVTRYRETLCARCSLGAAT